MSIVDEHFRHHELIAESYKNGNYNRCEKYCIENIQMFPRFKAEYMKLEELDNLDIRIPSFEILVKIYEKQKRYDEGIEVCDLALKYELKDTTKGGFKGRKEKLEKYKLNPPAVKLKIEPKDTENTALVECAKTLTQNNFSDLAWYISISFNKSSSSNFSKALFLLQNSSYKHYIFEYDGQTVYQAVFLDERQQFLNFIQLYELVSKWKSAFVLINGKFADRKIVSGINYCYGDKCRSGRSDFCYGASWATANPFGCHRLQISYANNPWWTFSHQQGNGLVIDKQAIKKRIDEYCRAYVDCPSFDYESVINSLNNLPDEISLRELNKLRNKMISYAETNNAIPVEELSGYASRAKTKPTFLTRVKQLFNTGQ